MLMWVRELRIVFGRGGDVVCIEDILSVRFFAFVFWVSIILFGGGKGVFCLIFIKWDELIVGEGVGL